tara:strand:- start:346 stop:474 length:129 start_codon:yes stop_codon:yes gene_type:complete
MAGGLIVVGYTTTEGLNMTASELFHIIAHAQSLAELKRKLNK